MFAAFGAGRQRVFAQLDVLVLAAERAVGRAVRGFLRMAPDELALATQAKKAIRDAREVATALARIHKLRLHSSGVSATPSQAAFNVRLRRLDDAAERLYFTVDVEAVPPPPPPNIREWFECGQILLAVKLIAVEPKLVVEFLVVDGRDRSLVRRERWYEESGEHDDEFEELREAYGDVLGREEPQAPVYRTLGELYLEFFASMLMETPMSVGKASEIAGQLMDLLDWQVRPGVEPDDADVVPRLTHVPAPSWAASFGGR